MDQALHSARTTRFLAAGTPLDCMATFGGPAVAFEPHSAGTVQYTDLNGIVQTQTFQVGVKPVYAKAIGGGTAVNLTVYFNSGIPG